MFFDELSNDEWALLAALVSDEPAVRLNRRGRPRAEPRIVANAVLWILTTGEPWSKLPGRYPSGPTCRRRFEEWQLNGTLLEMVRLLSRTGRTFAYIPQPAPPVAAKPAAPVAESPRTRDENLRGVSWRSPESWQAPGTANSLGNWRSADPIADMTRQLSGAGNGDSQRDPHGEMNVAPVTRALASHAAAPARYIARTPLARVDARVDEACAVHAAMHGLNAAIASACVPALDDRRSPLSMSLAPRGTEIAERGYVIYVAAEPVPNGMYRAWAEIMKDGKRVERSGLVGPRFAETASAQHHALDWARQWIDRECLTLAAAAESAAQASEYGQANGQAHGSVNAAARPLPALRHVPEPVAVNHSAPLHGPLNAFRGPLRRYPGEPAAVSSATESSASERFPSYTELISHAG